MKVLFKIIMGSLIFILYVLIVPAIYMLCYFKDCLVGRRFSLARIDKPNSWANKIHCRLYFRYKLPMLGLLFSGLPISIITIILKGAYFSVIIAGAIYLFLYFFGMYRIYKNTEKCYLEVLTHNEDFIELYFKPINFMISVVGITFAVPVLTRAGESFKSTFLDSVINFIMNYRDTTNIGALLGRIVLLIFLTLCLLYIMCLPLIIVSYAIISVIKYCIKHKEGVQFVRNRVSKITDSVIK